MPALQERKISWIVQVAVHVLPSFLLVYELLVSNTEVPCIEKEVVESEKE